MALVVDEDLARGGIVEAGEQRDDGALARAAGADERDHLAGLDGEADVVECGLADAVAEGDVAELDLALHARESRAARRSRGCAAGCRGRRRSFPSR